MARSKPLSSYPPTFEEAFRKAKHEGSFRIACPDNRVIAYRNELYAYRRAYQMEGSDIAFSSWMVHSKISRKGNVLCISSRELNPIIEEIDNSLKEVLSNDSSPSVSHGD